MLTLFSIVVVSPILISLIIEIMPGMSLQTVIFYQDAVILAVLALSIGFVSLVYSSYSPRDRVRTVWRMFLIGVVCFFVGESFYFVYEILQQKTDPFPCLGDVFIVAGYLAFIWAAVDVFYNYSDLPIFVENYGRRLSWVLSAVFVILVITLVIYPSVSNNSLPLRMRLIAQIYPVLDLFGFALYNRLFLMFLSMGNTRFSRPWLLLTIAFIVSLLADSAYAFNNNHGIECLYSWVNLSWYMAYALMALAFYRQHRLLQSIPTATP